MKHGKFHISDARYAVIKRLAAKATPIKVSRSSIPPMTNDRTR